MLRESSAPIAVGTTWALLQGAGGSLGLMDIRVVEALRYILYPRLCVASFSRSAGKQMPRWAWSCCCHRHDALGEGCGRRGATRRIAAGSLPWEG